MIHVQTLMTELLIGRTEFDFSFSPRQIGSSCYLAEAFRIFEGRKKIKKYLTSDTFHVII